MSRDRRHRTDAGGSTGEGSATGAVGKRTLTSRLVQRKASGPGTDPEAVTASLGAGAPLPADVRGRMEGAFGTDLGAVRVHEGGAATAACEQLEARAFAVGNDIAFRSGAFQPGTREGDHLIAHELAHTVQQGSAVATSSEVSQPDDPAEVAADRAADAVLAGETGVAARLDLGAAGVQRRIMRATATTYGGTFNTTTYAPVKKDISRITSWTQRDDFPWYRDNKDSYAAQPACKIILEFQANPLVDCAKVGLVQTVKPTRDGALDSSGDDKTARATKTSEGDKDTGRYLDRESGKVNPNYDVENPSQGIQNPTTGDLGKGKHLTDAQKGEWGDFSNGKKQAAWLEDEPSRERYVTNKQNKSGPALEMLFETAALCVEGPMAGTYLGSVEWGWKIGSTGDPSVQDFKAVSQGAPSLAFMGAAKRWNEQELDVDNHKTKTIPLPLTTSETSSLDLGNKSFDELYAGVEALVGKSGSEDSTQRLSYRGEILARLSALSCSQLWTEAKRAYAAKGTYRGSWTDLRGIIVAAIRGKATKAVQPDTWQMDTTEAREHDGQNGDLPALASWGKGLGALKTVDDWVYVFVHNEDRFTVDILAKIANGEQFKMPTLG